MASVLREQALRKIMENNTCVSISNETRKLIRQSDNLVKRSACSYFWVNSLYKWKKRGKYIIPNSCPGASECKASNVCLKTHKLNQSLLAYLYDGAIGVHLGGCSENVYSCIFGCVAMCTLHSMY